MKSTTTNNQEIGIKTVIHRANDRGHANHGWLNSWHSFSFANFYDEEKTNFGLLRVLNDDVVAPGMGFGKHPHNNMEIISIPLKGALEHSDTEGNKQVIHAGDVQIMSAGSGLQHAEYNHSKTDPVNFLQIWVFPKEKNIKPRYEQKTYDVNKRKNQFQTVVSPDNTDGGVWINQDSWFSLAKIEAGQEINYKLHKKGNGAYIFLLEGELEVSNQALYKRDAIGISNADSVPIKANHESEVLVIEVPMG